MPITGKLHYGGSLNSKGTLGSKPLKGSTFRSQRRYETIVRLENAAFPDAAIAAMLCLSVPRLQMIKKEPAYLTARMKLTHGIILDHEKQVSLIREQRKEILTQMLPPALQVIADELARQPMTLADRKHKATIALEVLDREGSFAKVSRAEIKPVSNFSFETADEDSHSIINALKGTGASPADTMHTVEAVAANEEFANSHTLSQTDQQAALDKLEEEAKKLGFLELMPTPDTVN